MASPSHILNIFDWRVANRNHWLNLETNQANLGPHWILPVNINKISLSRKTSNVWMSACDWKKFHMKIFTPYLLFIFGLSLKLCYGISETKVPQVSFHTTIQGSLNPVYQQLSTHHLYHTTKRRVWSTYNNMHCFWNIALWLITVQYWSLF